jgi:hypothetical protein
LRDPSATRKRVGHGLPAPDLLRGAHVHRAGVGSEDNVWIENSKTCVEATATSAREEGIDNFLLSGEIGMGTRGRVAAGSGQQPFAE